jgi:hypothetical protein
MASKNNSSSHGAKRPMSDSPEHSQASKVSRTNEPEMTITDNKFPRYLVASSQDTSKPLTRISPWKISKAVNSITNPAQQKNTSNKEKQKDEPKIENPKIQKLKSGELLIEVKERLHCEKLLRTTHLVNIPVRIHPHKVLNFSKGVIKSSDIGMCNEAEILEDSRDQGVVDVRCVTRRTPEGVVRTGTYFLTFDTPDLPEFIMAGYIHIPVSPYIPNPLRCFNCQKLGHSQNRCRSSKVCSKCSSSTHSYENCDSDPFCINCKGKHSPSDKKCPAWIKEKEIQSYKVTFKCSFPEARKAVESTFTGPAGSYAAAAKKTKIDHATQTDFGVQISGEEIDAEIRKAPSSQTCTHCPHCQSSIQIQTQPQQALFKESSTNIVPASSNIKEPNKALAPGPSEMSETKKSTSSSSLQPDKPQPSSSVNQESAPILSKQQTNDSTTSPHQNISAPKTPIIEKNTTTLPVANKFSALQNVSENEDMECNVTLENSQRPNENEFKLTKNQRKNLRKQQRRAALKENLKDRRPPKGAHNPLNEALFSDDEEVRELSQNTQPPPSNVQSKSPPPGNTNPRTEEENSNIQDAFEGFGQIVMDRPLHPRSDPIPIKRDNKLPT